MFRHKGLQGSDESPHMPHDVCRQAADPGASVAAAGLLAAAAAAPPTAVPVGLMSLPCCCSETPMGSASTATSVEALAAAAAAAGSCGAPETCFCCCCCLILHQPHACLSSSRPEMYQRCLPDPFNSCSVPLHRCCCCCCCCCCPSGAGCTAGSPHRSGTAANITGANPSGSSGSSGATAPCSGALLLLLLRCAMLARVLIIPNSLSWVYSAPDQAPWRGKVASSIAGAAAAVSMWRLRGIDCCWLCFSTSTSSTSRTRG